MSAVDPGLPLYHCNKVVTGYRNTHNMEAENNFTGIWVTANGYIRQELLPDGRYDETRGTRKSAYTGRYRVTGNYIMYWDDMGFTADGSFIDEDTLHHGGYIFYRENKPAGATTIQ